MDSTARFSFLCTWAWNQIRAASLPVKHVLRRWEQVNPWVGKSPSRRKPWASWPWSVTLWAFSGTREGLKTERLVEKHLYKSRWTLQQRDNNTWSFTAKLLWWQLVALEKQGALLFEGLRGAVWFLSCGEEPEEQEGWLHLQEWLLRLLYGCVRNGLVIFLPETAHVLQGYPDCFRRCVTHHCWVPISSWCS